MANIPVFACGDVAGQSNVSRGRTYRHPKVFAPQSFCTAFMRRLRNSGPAYIRLKRFDVGIAY